MKLFLLFFTILVFPSLLFAGGEADNVSYQGGTYAVIPYGVTYIDRDSGLSNKGLTSLKIPSSVTIIGDSAFNKNLLTSVTIPDSVTSIGYNAFSDNRLTSVTIPDSVIFIGSGAFANNDNLRSITIGADVNWNVDYSSQQSLSFTQAYYKNNRRAGTYTSPDGKNWNYSTRR